eukprot:SAG11_NODE_29683_length_308_cov_0.985646_1_plen_36_part_10
MELEAAAAAEPAVEHLNADRDAQPQVDVDGHPGDAV